MDKKIFFHEDDYLQIEILHRENKDFCKKQISNICDFTNEHKTNGGYTDIFVREESLKKSIKEYSIKVSEMEKALSKLFEISDNVFTGYGSYEVKCENTKAVYKDDDTVLYFEYEDEVINHIWLNRDIDETDRKIIYDMLNILSSLIDFILVDYDMLYILEFKNKEDIDKYITLIKKNC